MDADLWRPSLMAGLPPQLADTLLSRQGADNRFLLEQSASILSGQRQARDWGADILVTPTHLAGEPLLEQAGMEEDLEALNKELVSITKKAADGGALVAGRIAPAPLELEPFGETSFTELMACYRRQGESLKQAGADCFLVETKCGLQYARCAVLALRKLGLPLLVNVRLDEDGELEHSGNALNALAVLQALGVSAFGIRGEYSVELLEETLARLRSIALVPIMVQPARYRREDEVVSPLSAPDYQAHCEALLKGGASILFPSSGEPLSLAAKAVAQEKKSGRLARPAQPDADEVILADAKQVYCLDYDRLELSPLLACSADMGSELMRLEQTSFDALHIQLDTPQDAQDFARNEYMASLPVCFLSHDEITLKLALMLYNGVALVDAQSSLPEETLKKIAKKYGAVVY